MRLKRLWLIVLTLLILAIIAMYPLDSYISRPGSAYNIAPLVEIEEGKDEANIDGTFSLMTITLGKATPLTYAMSYFKKDMELLPADNVRMPDEDEAEYNLRQQRLMDQSKFNAITVAYAYADLPMTITYNGVVVMKVLEEGAANKKLQLGDIIVKVDGTSLTKEGQFETLIANKEKGDQVELEVNRDDKTVTETITLGEIPNGEGRVGLGIQYEEDRHVETEPEVEIFTENIGGPSAGFMFTMEIINRVTKEDLTKGYDIAGTGEMLADGTIGRIGGADFKVIAAANDGMDIFFAPDDDITDEMKTYNPQIESNYEEAKRTAEAIGTDMEIIPVKTIDDAMHYLEQLAHK